MLFVFADAITCSTCDLGYVKITAVAKVERPWILNNYLCTLATGAH